jgi:tRNA(Ile)-lysidine synthase TilS/MesJ
MQCDKCRNEAVFFQPYSGRHLCSRHLALDVEARAKRSIRLHHWMTPGNHIAVVLTGDKKSAALLLFLKKLTAGRRDIRLSAVLAGDRVGGMHGLSAATRVSESLGISSIEMPRPGRTRDPESDRVTSLARAFTLDDIAREVLLEFLSGNAEQLIHAYQDRSSMVPVICPFIAVPSDEVNSYWDHGGMEIDLLPYRPVKDPLSRDVETLFRDYQQRHPATGHALLNLAEELGGCRAEETVASATRRHRPAPSADIAGVIKSGT